MRQVRDRLRPASTMFAVATDLYYRSGPAAADVFAAATPPGPWFADSSGRSAPLGRSRLATYRPGDSRRPSYAGELRRRAARASKFAVDNQPAIPIIPAFLAPVVCACALDFRLSATNTEVFAPDAHHQSAGQVRPPGSATQDRVAGAHGLPAAARRLHARLHHHARRSRTRRCARSRVFVSRTGWK